MGIQGVKSYPCNISPHPPVFSTKKKKRTANKKLFQHEKLGRNALVNHISSPAIENILQHCMEHPHGIFNVDSKDEFGMGIKGMKRMKSYP